MSRWEVDVAMDLLLKVARRPIVERCLSAESGLGCSTIVRSQNVSSRSDFQVPEPWSGHISIAPILFLSSNPSIGQAGGYEQYPRASWPSESIVEYFDYRFGGKPLSAIEDGIYHVSPGSSRSRRGVRFWSGVKARAAELLEKPKSEVIPGTDYALTEVVRCKSVGEYGVPEAVATCVSEYLEPTLEQSASRVIVVLGSQAKRVVCARFGLDPSISLHGPLQVAKRTRLIVFLPHPSAYEPQTFSKCLLPSDVEWLRQWLREGEAGCAG
jgi:hypothetical protein